VQPITAKKRNPLGSTEPRPDLAKDLRLAQSQSDTEKTVWPCLKTPATLYTSYVRVGPHELEGRSATATACRHEMGFGSYREFQNYWHALSVSQATSIDTLETRRRKARTFYAPRREGAVDMDVRNCRSSATALGPDRTAAVAKRINSARLLLFGRRSSPPTWSAP